MNKYITDKLIEERLNKQGYSSEDSYGAEDEDADYKKLCEYYDFELIDTFNGRAEYFIYSETTADGYEVWVTTESDQGAVNVSEDIHYYDSDLNEVLCDQIRHGGGTIFVEDMEAYYVNDAMSTMFDNMIESIKAKIIVELEEEGYEYENTEAVA
jgi:uncharacterized protein YqkB